MQANKIEPDYFFYKKKEKSYIVWNQPKIVKALITRFDLDIYTSYIHSNEILSAQSAICLFKHWNVCPLYSCKSA